MEKYNPLAIEQKWQKIWQETQAFKATEPGKDSLAPLGNQKSTQAKSPTKTPQADPETPQPKIYLAEMFPYPSGAGLHVGHVRNFTIVDVLARFHAQQGFNVLRPFGYDTFGLPAENYAIKTGIPPAQSTAQNIQNFRKQAQKLGFAIDWSREVNTSDPEYYRWTQWCFLQLYKKGLAYRKESYQWWCPVDQTVLANEQVENGRCWRCGHEVEKKKMKQWFFRITAYADELLEEIDALDWPEKIKIMQKNWIGRSVGAEITFQIESSKSKDGAGRDVATNGEEAANITFEGRPQVATEDKRRTPVTTGRANAVRKSDIADSARLIKVFTTRPDTIFGATFLVLAPEHPLVHHLIIPQTEEKVNSYIEKTLKKSEIERQENKEKTGVFTGSYALNPATGAKIPIWISDYVLMGYGEGAIMAVPAHDQRDYEFAQKFDLPIQEVVERPEDVTDSDLCYHGEGTLVNSGQFNGQNSADVREEIVAWLEQQGLGHAKTTYRMRDWLISRQRYWGCPIPIAYDKNGDPHPIPEDQLPVQLPEVTDYQPDKSGRSALAKATDWLQVEVPLTDKDGQPILDSKTKKPQTEMMTRETDTLDGYACSSWYLWRYVSPHDAQHAWDPEAIKYWAPTDIYVGADHAVAHLLYVRFWCKVFADLGLLPFREPVKKLLYNGYINAPDGKKMSKSKGNVIDPLDVIDSGYGADTLRTYEMFIGPYDEDAAWNTQAIGGVYRFLNRCWTLAFGSESNISHGEFSDEKHSDVDSEAGGGNSLGEGRPQVTTEDKRRTPVTTGRANAVRDKAVASSSRSVLIRHKTIKKVTEDLHRHSFNTAVAALMEYVNELYKLGATPDEEKSPQPSIISPSETSRGVTRKSKQASSSLATTALTQNGEKVNPSSTPVVPDEDIIVLAQLLKPFAPHLASEILEKYQAPDTWPVWDESALVSTEVEYVVQVSGKLRAKFTAAPDLPPEELEALALAQPNVQKYLSGAPRKVIIPARARLVNLIP